ncbi:MAG: urea ABC transporter ATP-binding protein UrtD [Ectothiorhodospiraceae bacterium]|nr:urea ABC transporter ATP-binding protein UrtD [Ectothiorhodospiraceae bacterium]
MAQLELKQLVAQFGGVFAVNKLDLSIRQGELRCLLGPNGAGKSTTLDLICGKTPPTGGQIVFDGRDITNLAEFRRARAGIGRKFQTPSVFKELSVIENLELARSREPGVLASLRVFRTRVTGRLREVLELVSLQDDIHTRAGNLSHGQMQWLEIAMLLVQDANLLLFDEPTAGMTIQETHRTGEIFNSLKGSHTMIVVEHDMSFVRQIAETVTVMHQGSLLAEGCIEEVESDPGVREAYLGDGGRDHA